MSALIPNPASPPQSQAMVENTESTLRQNLTAEFRDEDYRYSYAESFLNTKLASQIKTLRQQRGLTQAKVAELMDIRQPGYARFEDVNHSVWKTDTLWQIARALDVRVNISFESFGSLIGEKEHFDKEHLERPTFKDDPVFNEESRETAKQPGTSLRQAMVNVAGSDFYQDLVAPDFYPDLMYTSGWDWALDIFSPTLVSQQEANETGGIAVTNPPKVSRDAETETLPSKIEVGRQYQKVA
jgi:transcriptional regulator with XRE-family HTH domain